MSTLPSQQIMQLSGIGQSTAKQLHILNINTIFGLLLHLPRGYEDRSVITPVSMARSGQHLLFEGSISHVHKPNNFSRSSVTATFSDGSGELRLRFFKSYPGLRDKLSSNSRLRIFGEVKNGRYGFELHHPEIQVVTTETPLPPKQLTPIYPTTKGLTQNKLRTLIRTALKHAQQHTPNNLLPSKLIKHHLSNPLTLLDALLCLHQPTSSETIAELLHDHPARQRITLEELSAHYLSLLHRRNQLKQQKAPKCVSQSPLATRFLENLPFTPTSAQSRVSAEIVADISQSQPMLRLVQGDVGAGKTVVAALAACHALDAGWQVAIMAPTEILAEQHFLNFQAWFEPLGISVAWLSGKLKAAERRSTLEAISENDAQLIVGTHALFQENVVFAKLGLVIIDEQHRFGVEQRLALRDKGVGTPHQLVMTATPIPRTLAMSQYGDMDTSVIDELPPGRTPVTTLTVAQDRRNEVIERIAKNCAEGKQAYWVCPLVEDSDKLDVSAAEVTFAQLEDSLNINVGLVHGKMKAAEKQAVMQQFKAGEIQLLVATTVIEVGVDVPNASLMIIENAERMGLSQLHQLRGRVGRGSQASYCVLMYKKPLSENGIARLNVLKNSTDGFVIAEKDLELRGPGELMGKRQTGNVGFYVANLQTDQTLIEPAYEIAEKIIANHPDLVEPLIARWLRYEHELSQV